MRFFAFEATLNLLKSIALEREIRFDVSLGRSENLPVSSRSDPASFISHNSET